MTRHVLHAVAALVLVAACGGDDGSGSGTRPSTQAAQAASQPTGATSMVEGTWRTEPISVDEIRGTLDAAGLTDWADQFLALEAPPDDMVITLSLEDGAWTSLRADGDEPPGVNDRGTFTVEGDRLLYTPFSGGLNTYQWTISGDQLTLLFISSSEPDFQGVPGEVFQRVFYTSAPFHRVEP